MDTLSLGDIVEATVGRFRLVSEERRLGAKVHEALRIELPAISALDLAARYLPAGDAVVAGGDFAEVNDLDGCYTVVIGDVVGHGVDAAVRSVQLRSELATALHVTRDPATALAVLDERSARRGDGYIATAMGLLIDPARRIATIATAGHPPPLLMNDDRTSEWLRLPAGPPIGVVGPRPASTVMAFGSDQVMLCFTDGVIERPGVLLDHGVAHLAARVLGGDGLHPCTTVAVVDTAMDVAVEFADRRDDAVAIALRLN